LERIAAVELHGLALRGGQILKCPGDLEEEWPFWLADIGRSLLATGFRFLGEEHGTALPSLYFAHHYTLIGVKEGSAVPNVIFAA
jgi:hypothetical protein